LLYYRYIVYYALFCCVLKKMKRFAEKKKKHLNSLFVSQSSKTITICNALLSASQLSTKNLFGMRFSIHFFRQHDTGNSSRFINNKSSAKHPHILLAVH
jgi:hypothetical protein